MSVQKNILNMPNVNREQSLEIDAGQNVRLQASNNQALRLDDVFFKQVTQNSPAYLTDEILPEGVLLEFVSVDVLNSYINYVDLKFVLAERDPIDDERHISISNRYYTHFHEFGTVLHVVAASKGYLWYFCYDIDANFCVIGRVRKTVVSLEKITNWVRNNRVSGRFPFVEIDVNNLYGWRSFQ